jgi:Mrp family chromosome partitioning ATPase
VITSGEIPDSPSQLLSNRLFAQMLEELREDYSVVIIDCPVVLAVSDALMLASFADGTLMVNRPGSVDSAAFEAMRVDLRRVGAKLVGMVANAIHAGDRYEYPSYLDSPYNKGPSRSGMAEWLKRRLAG